jgi:ABC-type nitrate/sulfonate/bicarbonate transport system permease component
VTALRVAIGRAEHPARATRSRAARAAPLRGLLPLTGGLLAWQVLADAESAYFPPPSSWWDALVGLWEAGRLGPAIVTTFLSFVAALALASAVGAALGIALGRSRALDRLLGPAFEFGRTLPAGALVPVAVLVIGYTASMKLAVAVFTSLWPVLLNTRAGARQLSRERAEVAKVLRLSRMHTLRKVLLPSLLPSFFIGVQVAAPVALIIVLLVEIVTHLPGVGGEIAIAQANFQSAIVYGLVMVTGLFGLAVNLFIGQLARVMRRYDPRARAAE